MKKFWESLKSKYYNVVLLVQLAVYAGLIVIVSNYFSDAWNTLPKWFCIASLAIIIIMHIGMTLYFKHLFSKFAENDIMIDIKNCFIEIYSEDPHYHFDKDCYKAIITNSDLAEIERTLPQDSYIWIVSKTVNKFDLKGGVFFDSIQENLMKGIRYVYFFAEENYKADSRRLLSAHRMVIERASGDEIMCSIPLPNEFFLTVPFDLTLYNPDKGEVGGMKGFIGIESESEEDFNIKLHDSFINDVYGLLVEQKEEYDKEMELDFTK